MRAIELKSNLVREKVEEGSWKQRRFQLRI